MASGMAWTDPIDAYCERLGPGFWAEPLNAWTNLAFLLAALLAPRLGFGWIVGLSPTAGGATFRASSSSRSSG